MSYKLYNNSNQNIAGHRVELLMKFTDLKVQTINIQMSDLKKPEFLAIHPMGKIPAFVTPEGTIYESMTILRYIARKTGKFYGKTPVEAASIDQWLDFFNTQVNPNSPRVIYPIFGFAEVTRENFDAGKKCAIQTFKIIDSQLAKNDYIGGKDLSIADFAFLPTLRMYMRMVFDEKSRAAIPNVAKWYERMFSHKQVADHFGKPWLCVKEYFPSFIQPAKDNKEEPKKKDEGKKKEQKKKEEKKKQQPKKKKKQEAEVDDEPKEEKKKNPLDELPKSSFNIDDWKRQFCNAEDKKAALKQTWQKFDHEGWSLWRVDYDKYEGEGVVGYLTNNLKNGYLRNIDHFRKYTFCVFGVYGTEGNYDITGIWLWRGTEIPEQWKGHPSYDYFKFKKLDPRDEKVQNLTSEFWLNTNEGDIVEGRPVFDAKWWK